MFFVAFLLSWVMAFRSYAGGDGLASAAFLASSLAWLGLASHVRRLGERLARVEASRGRAGR